MRTLYIDTSSSYLYSAIVEDNNILGEIKEVLHNESLDDFEMVELGKYSIKEDVLIEKPLGHIRYVLSCGDEIIYDSKDKLFRDYIFFNGSGTELNNNRDYKIDK